MFPAKRWRKRTQCTKVLKRRPGTRPALEVLEDRLAPAAWTALGPAAINNGWNGNEAASGRIAALAGDPTDPNTIYIAAAGGGVWKTSNASSASPTWTPLTDSQSTLFMGSIAVAAGSGINGRVIYAGTGEANFSGHDTFYGRGVLVSRDSGATWTLTGNTIFNRVDIGSVVIDPTDATGNTAYVAVSGEPDNGLNGGDTGKWGIWKTTNGGTNWTNTTASVVDSSTASVNPFTSLIMDPNNHNILYAAVGEPSNFSGTNDIYKTINGGGSWTLTSFPGASSGRITLAIAKNSTTLYASVSDPSSSNFGATLEIEKSIDAGASWNAVMTETSTNYINYMGGQGWYDQTLICDPSDSTGNTVYAAGQADPNLYPLDSVIKTTNGGTTWSDITQGPDGTLPHVDHHGIGFDANGKLLDGNDGGIWRLDNPTVGSIHWTDLNGNLNITEFTGTALDPTTATVAYGGSQDNGTEKYTGATAWNLSFGGDGGFVRVNPTNHLNLYTENFGISLQRSTDGGATWTDVSGGITGTAPQDNNPIGEASFYIPYVLDPTNPSRIVLGTTNINQSLNQGNNWTTIATPSLNGFNPGTDATGTQAGVTAIATLGNVVYAAMSDGTVWATGNDGGSWAEHNPMPPANFSGGVPFVPGGYQDLEIDPTDPSGNTAYIVTGQFEGDISGTAASPHHVFMTTNGGTTWTDISGNLPDLPVWSIAIDHGHNTLYVGTDNGVYVSTNGGTSWTVMGTGLPNVQVTSLEFDAGLGVLAAGTHGRGLWEIPITASPEVTSVTPSSGPANGGTSVTISGGFFTAASTVKFGATAATSATFLNSGTLMATSPAETAGTVDVTVTTVNGTSSTSAVDQFTFVTPPTVTGISPSSGPGAGGTAVTITGTNFTPASTVNFGATPALNVFFVSATDLAVVAPPGTVDSSVDVTVTTAGGVSATSAADKFTYYGPLAEYNVAVVGSSTVTAGSNFAVTVQAADNAGTPITNYSGPLSVTASINPSSATSNFPVTVSLNSAGFGFFLGNIQAVGSYTITTTGGAITGSTSTPVSVVTAAPDRVAFTVQPANTPTGVTLPALTVQIQDAFGNVISTDNTDSVSLAISSGPGNLLPGSTSTGTVVGGSLNFNNLKFVVPGTYLLTATVNLAGHLIGAVSSPFTVLPLQVLAGSFAGTPSGFSLQFNAPYLVTSLTPVLYGQGFGATAPAPSVIVTTDPANLGDTKAYVQGTLVLSPATSSMTFVATDTAGLQAHGTPVLPDGTYTVIVRASAATDGFQALNAGGGFLDGLGTGTPGSGDFRASFAVNASAAGDDVVWVPAVAEGPGQVLNAPGKNLAGGGYPIYLDSSSTAITSVQVTVNYNPALLTVTGVTGTGFSLLGTSTPGHAVLQYSGAALAAGTETPIGFLTATVPGGTGANPVPYKMKDLLHLSSVLLNNSAAVKVTTADALHLVAYVADADGNGSYSSNDAVLITRALLNTDTGFGAYPLVDPVIVADTDGSSFIPADAALQANEAGVGLPTANLSVPPIPAGVNFQVIGNNVDPALTVERGPWSVDRSTVTVAVNIDDAHPTGSTGLIEGHLALTYDPRAFIVSPDDVHLGSVLAAGSGWSIVPTIDPPTGQIAIALSSTTPITSTIGGSLVTIDFHAVGQASSLASIVLVPSTTPDGQYVATELEDAQGSFTLTLLGPESVVTLIRSGSDGLGGSEARPNLSSRAALLTQSGDGQAVQSFALDGEHATTPADAVDSGSSTGLPAQPDGEQAQLAFVEAHGAAAGLTGALPPFNIFAGAAAPLAGLVLPLAGMSGAPLPYFGIAGGQPGGDPVFAVLGRASIVGMDPSPAAAAGRLLYAQTAIENLEGLKVDDVTSDLAPQATGVQLNLAGPGNAPDEQPALSEPPCSQAALDCFSAFTADDADM